MFSGKSSSSSLRSVQKRLSKSFQRAGEMITGIGPLPIKAIRDAIDEGDEDKAVQIFASELAARVHADISSFGPSVPISASKQNGITLLHLAALMAFDRLVSNFLENGGNPNQLTTRMETCLHFVCGKDDKPLIRLGILEKFVSFRGASVSGGDVESISINRVDDDGNTATHKAASNGLGECVKRLVMLGAIISIVNKSQLTCCELADENGHRELAAALELALMFQPEDVDMQSFVEAQDLLVRDQASHVLPDCRSLKLGDIEEILNRSRDRVFRLFSGDHKMKQYITTSRVDVILEKFSWDVARIHKEFISSPSSVFASALLPEVLVPFPEFDSGSWIAESTPSLTAKLLVDSSTILHEKKSDLLPTPCLSSPSQSDSNSLSGIVEQLAVCHKVSDKLDKEIVGESGTSAGSSAGTAVPQVVPATESVSLDDIMFDEDNPSSPDEPEKVSQPMLDTSGDSATIVEQNLSMMNVTPVANYSVTSPLEVSVAVASNEDGGSIPDIVTKGLGNSNPVEVISGSNIENVKGAVEPNTIRVKLLAGNIRVRIRPEASLLKPEIGFASNGDEFDVFEETTNGFFKLANGAGYILKNANGIFWELVGRSSREFPSEPCAICGEQLLRPVPPTLLLSQEDAIRGRIKENGMKDDPSSNMPIQAQLDFPNRDQRAVYCSAGHGFCLSCWSTYTSTQVLENGAFSLKCPGYKCSEILGDEWLPVLLPDRSLKERFISQRLHHIVDCCKGLRWCPHKGCELIISVCEQVDHDGISPELSAQISRAIPQSAVCHEGHSFCLACNKDAHSPCSCANWELWQQKVAEEMKSVGGVENSGNVKTEDVANAMWVAANTKKCPRCNTPIEKDEGCNHMSCRKCRYEFCWICMQDWALHSAGTGGYFQCNRFLGGESDEMLYPDDAGSAQHETRRMQRSGQRMARFIHHFTRFQAHGDSLRMERRMHRETLVRIITSLVKAADGDLAWIVPNASNPLVSDSGFSSPATRNDILTAIGLESNRVVAKPDALLLTPTRSSLSSAQDSGTASSTPAKVRHSSRVLATLQTLSRPSFYLNGYGKKYKATGTVASNISGSSPSVQSPSAQVALSEGVETAGSGIRLDCISFLNDGFDELTKCRLLLRSTFPFAYFAFADEETRGEPETLTQFLHSISLSEDYQSRSQRARMLSRKPQFEQLQSDLEMITELLSDVVARRRLRASQSQIVQVTKGARAKRIEFESIIYSWVMTDTLMSNEQKQREQSRAQVGNSYERGMNSNTRRILQLQGTRAQQTQLRSSRHQAPVEISPVRVTDTTRYRSAAESRANLQRIFSENYAPGNVDEVPAMSRVESSADEGFSPEDDEMFDLATYLMAIESLQLHQQQQQGVEGRADDPRNLPVQVTNAVEPAVENQGTLRVLPLASGPTAAFSSIPESPETPSTNSATVDLPNSPRRGRAVDNLGGIDSTVIASRDPGERRDSDASASTAPDYDHRAGPVVVNRNHSANDTYVHASSAARDEPFVNNMSSNVASSSRNSHRTRGTSNMQVAALSSSPNARRLPGRNLIDEVLSGVASADLLREADQDHIAESDASAVRGARVDDESSTSYLTLNDLSNTAALRITRLSLQAEEMAELNKAILLSLEANQPRLNDAEPNDSVGNIQIADTLSASPESVNTLMAMGFKEEDCIKALRRCRNNLDRAADMLLSS